MPPLGVDVSLAARRLTASPLADEINPLNSEYGPPVEFGVSLSHPSIFSVRRATRPSRRCGPRQPAEHHSTVSAILKPFPPAWRGLSVRCPKSYNLPSDAVRAFPSSGFLFSLLAEETIRLARLPWSHVKTLTRSPGGLAVRMRRSSIRCRESRSPVGCCESLLVGRPKLFLSA